MLSLLATLGVLLVAGLPTSGAAFVASTLNLGNQASTMVIEPPTAVTIDLDFQLLPPKCSATIVWTASSAPSVASYEVVRVSIATGTVLEGPWIVTGTSTVDDDLPLLFPGAPWEWRVRSIDGDWRSEWAVATADVGVLCV